MKSAWTIVVLLLIATACGPTTKLRRAEKLIKKAEELGATWRTDTVYVNQAVPVPEIRVDSIIVSLPGDTVTILKDRLQVKYVRLRGDTVFIDAACLPDTIKVKVPVTVEKRVEAKGWLRWWMLVLAFIAGVFLWMGVIQARKASAGK